MTASRIWALAVLGYSVLAAAMVAFLTINGTSSTAVGTIATAGLIGLGLMLPAVAMLELTRRFDPSQRRARTGLALQAVYPVGLLIGLLLSFFASSLPGHVLSAAFIVLAAAAGLIGAALISRQAGVPQLVVGVGLIAAGAALIPASNIAVQMDWVSDLEKNVLQDLGATVAACGCVVAAYSCFVIGKLGQPLRTVVGDRAR